MEPNQPASVTPHPSSRPLPLVTSSVSLPKVQIALKEVDTLLFVIERSSLDSSLTNILSAAALYRAIRNERGTAPQLRVTGEIALCNALSGFGECEFTKQLAQGEQALLISAASFYRKQLAQLVGAYVLSGGFLHGTLNGVDDAIPLGKREDPRIPIREFVARVVSESHDPIVQSLLALAHASEGEARDPRITKYRAALTALHRENIPFRRDRGRTYLETFPTVTTMIQELAQGVEVPSCIEPLIDRYQDAEQIAQSIWDRATQIAPGVFQLHEIPYDERDVIVDALLQDLYQKDPRARFVLERGHDGASTGLTYSEALAFERRLGAGEDAQALIDEVAKILEKRGDRGSLTDLELADMRGREPQGTLETLLRKAQYIPDPSDTKYTIHKYPADVRMVKALARHELPIITHNALWLCNLQTGEAEPVIISFQAQYLARFLEAFCE